MARDHLRVVDENTTPKPKPVPASIEEALDGSSRDVLAAMRLKLAQKLDAGEVAANAIASSYKELRELDRLIRAADAAEEQEKSDDDEDAPRRTWNPAAI